MRRLNASPFKVVMVSNQAGVAKGYFVESLVHACNRRMEELLDRESARLDGLYYCPHHPEGSVDAYRVECNCRKPATGMVDRAASELGLDLKGSYMIGDRYSDIELAHNAGVWGVLVLTGYGKGEWEYKRDRFLRRPAHVAEDLLGAVEWILAREGCAGHC